MKTNISKIKSENVYPCQPIVDDGKNLIVGGYIDTRVKIDKSKVVAATGTGVRIHKSCSDVLLDDGSVYRVRVILNQITKLLNLERIHQTVSVKLDKLECKGYRDSVNSNFVKVRGHKSILPIASKSIQSIGALRSC